MAGVSDSVGNIALLAAKVAELATLPEGRMLIALALAKSGYSPDKLDQHTKTLRVPPAPSTNVRKEQP